MEKIVKPLKYKSLDGFSEKQLSEHHDVLYAGYVKKINEIRAAIPNAKLDSANGTYAEIRELKLEETFAWNAIKLHEGYFDNLGGKGDSAVGKIAEWIAKDFGSYDKWVAEFAALGLCARGWVVLAMDLETGNLHNIVCDVHNQGGVWGCVPLIILDVYEHAYFLDYATARKKYIESFIKNLDWSVADDVVKCYKLETFRK
ncbi:MAG: Fe-Mn family superoxide dismutase [Nanoarchaeota archaeon]